MFDWALNMPLNAIIQKTSKFLRSKNISGPYHHQLFKNIIILQHLSCLNSTKLHLTHCVKSVRIRSYSGPYFPTFGLNADQNNIKYGHFLRSEYRVVITEMYISWMFISSRYIKKKETSMELFLVLAVGSGKFFHFKSQLSSELHETMRKLGLSTKFHTRKVGEITAFKAVFDMKNVYK